ncbi:GPP34-domain-containing protein [Mycena venus]|uniref:GPP34-domain-containing protein n=1 Tax=Mycena venus TaxID=2733690 RepID=A0A8H7DGQ3_9AGAR|nr:GPP34-domain-containing protein [Mycena venus]
MMKQTEDANEKMGVGTWVDLEYSVSKPGMSSRLAYSSSSRRGAGGQGVLRTEKCNFLFFDIATHPVADARVKAGVANRVVALLTSRMSAVPPPRGLLRVRGVHRKRTR